MPMSVGWSKIPYYYSRQVHRGLQPPRDRPLQRGLPDLRPRLRLHPGGQEHLLHRPDHGQILVLRELLPGPEVHQGVPYQCRQREFSDGLL